MRVVESHRWQRKINKQAARLIDDADWRRLMTADAAACRRMCDRLASLAAQLGQASKAAKDTMKALTRAAELTSSPLIDRIAGQLAKQAVAPVTQTIGPLRRGMQITGVFLCACADRHMEKCACLKQLLDEWGPRVVKSVLRRAFDEFLAVPATA